MRRGLRSLIRIHLLFSGVLFNIALIAVLLLVGKYFYELRLPFSVLVERSVIRLNEKNPALSSTVKAGFSTLGVLSPEEYLYGRLYRIDPASPDWRGWGARPDRVFAAQAYDESGKPMLPVSFNPATEADNFDTGSGGSGLHRVDSVSGLHAAIAAASPGERILIEPGDYDIKGNIEIRRPGRATRPIRLMAQTLGQVRLRVSAPQAFLVRAPYWVFDNLEIQGVCERHDACEHAYHIVGSARGTVIRNNRLFDFNAMVKVNGESEKGARVYPDLGLLESSSLFNRTVRDTGNPVTPVDIVGASGWQIRNNLIADFAKGRGDRISYAAFAKGGASDTLFERNLVVCQLRVPAGGDIRLGLSFGGGGTDASACRDRRCEAEHVRGTMRNNIIMHCPTDVGIYINKAKQTEIYNNTLYNTLGIDVRFPESTAVVFNNILSGRIHDRDGGLSVRATNLVSAFSRDLERDVFHRWFRLPEAGNFRLVDGEPIVDKGTAKADLRYDFCGNPRHDGAPDIGAMEYGQAPPCMPLPANPEGRLAQD